MSCNFLTKSLRIKHRPFKLTNCCSRIFYSSLDLEPEQTDVLIVGGGPAGLSAAIRIKQISLEQSKPIRVVLIEKGSEIGTYSFTINDIGSHILSGAVLEPSSLNELLPGWNNKENSKYPKAPPHQPVLKDEMVFLTKNLSVPLPKPPQMNNKGNYIISLSNFSKWLSEIAENLGVEIYPGTCGSKVFNLFYFISRFYIQKILWLELKLIQLG